VTGANAGRIGERLASVCPGTGWLSAVRAGTVALKIPNIPGRNGTGRYGPVRIKPRISVLLISGFGVQVPDGAPATTRAPLENEGRLSSHMVAVRDVRQRQRRRHRQAVRLRGHPWRRHGFYGISAFLPRAPGFLRPCQHGTAPTISVRRGSDMTCRTM
jgi:hypothetical protein